jgi:hypothetical protein
VFAVAFVPGRISEELAAAEALDEALADAGGVKEGDGDVDGNCDGEDDGDCEGDGGGDGVILGITTAELAKLAPLSVTSKPPFAAPVAGTAPTSEAFA